MYRKGEESQYFYLLLDGEANIYSGNWEPDKETGKPFRGESVPAQADPSPNGHRPITDQKWEYTASTGQLQSLSRNIPHPPTNRSLSIGICARL